jgi:hypothetical protein
MTLKLRRSLQHILRHSSARDEQAKQSTGRARSILTKILVLLSLVAILHTQGIFDSITGSKGVLKLLTGAYAPGTSFEIAPNVQGVVNFASGSDDSAVSLGPHQATYTVGKSCKNPALWMRVEGDALVGVTMTENADSWSGSFSLPIEGKYRLVAYWYGCDGKGTPKNILLKTFTAKGIASLNQNSMYPKSAWISSKRFPQKEQIIQPYVWHDPKIPTEKATLLKTSETIISQEGAVMGETGFYDFTSLSNYELVCWIGSESAESLKTSFLQLCSLLFPRQRPFKFHLYPIHNFVKPDRDWSLDYTKTRFRKCKHILVSLDEVKEPVSQSEYTSQVTTFINHLLKAIPDETFPIWMFTAAESPTKPSNCHSPSLPRSSEHPCNVALKELFRQSPFPSRVQLLDSTEITLPQLLGDNPKDVASVIALRIFVFVGKQVQTWRANGQVGHVKGLTRGNKTEPNFELIAYTGWT